MIPLHFRRELLAYLKGEREQPPQTVDLLAPIPAPIPVSRLIDQNEPEAKKARFDGEENRFALLDDFLSKLVKNSHLENKQIRNPCFIDHEMVFNRIRNIENY